MHQQRARCHPGLYVSLPPCSTNISHLLGLKPLNILLVIQAPPLSGPYIPQPANISAFLRSHRSPLPPGAISASTLQYLISASFPAFPSPADSGDAAKTLTLTHNSIPDPSMAK
ncbi:hypothetical protein PFLUV_G00236500 [Perca fluviatilis]|uniref:Uncharacterized protein n=1 Tax=Perca fluviatilis TaxID=8168 RepID=A0A6A5EMC6_PERFL|nr:hypothetical protein PFLUV_G00236500 [Perca fluviatilis]